MKCRPKNAIALPLRNRSHRQTNLHVIRRYIPFIYNVRLRLPFARMSRRNRPPFKKVLTNGLGKVLLRPGQESSLPHISSRWSRFLSTLNAYDFFSSCTDISVFCSLSFSSESSLASGRFWMDCLTGLTESLRNKDRAQEESSEKFEEQITSPFQQLQDLQREHIKDLPKEQEQEKENVARQWKVLKRMFTSERSPWGAR